LFLINIEHETFVLQAYYNNVTIFLMFRSVIGVMLTLFD
jgi:hypothetical protein